MHPYLIKTYPCILTLFPPSSPAELLLVVLSEDGSYLHELANAIVAERALFFRANPTHEVTESEHARLRQHELHHDRASHGNLLSKGIGIAAKRQAGRGASEPNCSQAAIRSKLKSRVSCLALPPLAAPLPPALGSPECPSYLERVIGGDEMVQVRCVRVREYVRVRV